MQRESLVDLPRKEIQKLAKENGIKANLKTTELIEKLCALGTNSNSPTKVSQSRAKLSKSPAAVKSPAEAIRQSLGKPTALQVELPDNGGANTPAKSPARSLPVSASQVSKSPMTRAKNSSSFDDTEVEMETMSMEKRRSLRSSRNGEDIDSTADKSLPGASATATIEIEVEQVQFRRRSSIAPTEKAPADHEVHKPKLDRNRQVLQQRKAAAKAVADEFKNSLKSSRRGDDDRTKRRGKTIADRFERIHNKNFNKMKAIDGTKTEDQSTRGESGMTPWMVLAHSSSTRKSRAAQTPTSAAPKTQNVQSPATNTPKGRLENLLKPTVASSKKVSERKSKPNNSRFNGSVPTFTLDDSKNATFAQTTEMMEFKGARSSKTSVSKTKKSVKYVPYTGKIPEFKMETKSIFLNGADNKSKPLQKKKFDLQASLANKPTWKMHKMAKPNPKLTADETENIAPRKNTAPSKIPRLIGKQGGQLNSKRDAALKVASAKKAAIIAKNRPALPADLPVKYT